MFGERLFSVQRSAFSVRGCSCSMFCSAPFAACCFVRRSVRKGWACGVLFDVVFFLKHYTKTIEKFGGAPFLWRGVFCSVFLFGVQYFVHFCSAFCSDELNVWTFV